jgi:methionyl-tRNA synthetase
MVHRYRDGVVPAAEIDPALAAEIDGLGGEVCALLDRADLSAAGEAIWLRVRRLNRYVEEQAPWTLAKDPERAGELDAVLASLIEGLRVVAVLLHPWMPETTDKLLAALGSPQVELECARAQAGRLGAIETLEPLFPKH